MRVELDDLVAVPLAGVGHRHRHLPRGDDRLAVPERGVGEPVAERVQRILLGVEIGQAGLDDVVLVQVGG
jgi:hypothetical protein